MSVSFKIANLIRSFPVYKVLVITIAFRINQHFSRGLKKWQARSSSASLSSRSPGHTRTHILFHSHTELYGVFRMFIALQHESLYIPFFLLELHPIPNSYLSTKNQMSPLPGRTTWIPTAFGNLLCVIIINLHVNIHHCELPKGSYYVVFDFLIPKSCILPDL